jgi:hypothetical protein
LSFQTNGYCGKVSLFIQQCIKMAGNLSPPPSRSVPEATERPSLTRIISESEAKRSRMSVAKKLVLVGLVPAVVALASNVMVSEHCLNFPPNSTFTGLKLKGRD